MAISKDPRQVWCLVRETLPYGTRWAPAPLPGLPEFRSPEYHAASPQVRHAAWLAHDAEITALCAAHVAAWAAYGRAARA